MDFLRFYGTLSRRGKPIEEQVKLMNIEKEYFGQTRDGEPVHRYLIEGQQGASVALIDFGAIVQSVRMPDRDGGVDEISLGFDSLRGYLDEHPYFGATVGRYANRIDSGSFELGGQAFTLAVNNSPNHLHGGLRGFDKALWSGDAVQAETECGVCFKLTSPDGEEGYPGELQVSVLYMLNADNRLTISYEANTSRPTPVNLTNHTYWNLSGAGSGNILGHQLSIVADRYLPVDESLIPTGELSFVEGGAMDFRNPLEIGSRFDSVEGGYDHCFVLGDSVSEVPRPAAILRDPASGRSMRVSTTEPGIQLYTGNFLDGLKGAGGKTFDRHGALCLEAQHFPDSPNQESFPSTILNPGDTYRQVTVHEFSAA